LVVRRISTSVNDKIFLLSKYQVGAASCGMFPCEAGERPD
jgi:hypothetical protein